LRLDPRQTGVETVAAFFHAEPLIYRPASPDRSGDRPRRVASEDLQFVDKRLAWK